MHGPVSFFFFFFCLFFFPAAYLSVPPCLPFCLSPTSKQAQQASKQRRRRKKFLAESNAIQQNPGFRINLPYHTRTRRTPGQAIVGSDGSGAAPSSKQQTANSRPSSDGGQPAPTSPPLPHLPLQKPESFSSQQKTPSGKKRTKLPKV